jgi:hypothetical protein
LHVYGTLTYDFAFGTEHASQLRFFAGFA